jgi:hypothetical protein
MAADSRHGAGTRPGGGPGGAAHPGKSPSPGDGASEGSTATAGWIADAGASASVLFYLVRLRINPPVLRILTMDPVICYGARDADRDSPFLKLLSLE